MKSATSTLQEQLALQPGIFMTEPKEPNFFSDDEQYSKGITRYSGLFSQASGGDLLGEASTHYTKLPTYSQSVERMREHLTDVRLIYVMRHPIDRLVSHYIHEWSMGNINCGIDEAVDKYPELVFYSQYAMQLRPFFFAYGRNTVLPVFFDKLTNFPQTELERVCRFIGYKGSPKWAEGIKPNNVSSQRLRRFPLYDFVVTSSLATQLRRVLIPQRCRDWVKDRLTMKKRPVLSDETKILLETKFNQDLEQLGKWLGVSLCCDNFKQLTGSRDLEWVAFDD